MSRLIEKRDDAMKLFDAELRERAEPTGVMAGLRQAVERYRSSKSSQALSADEIEWLRGVLAEGEAAIAAIKTLLGEADQAARFKQTVQLKNEIRAKRVRSSSSNGYGY